LRDGLVLKPTFFILLRAFAFLLLLPYVQIGNGNGNHLETVLAAFSGLAKFTLFFSLVIFVLQTSSLQKAMPLLILLTVFDLSFAFKYFSNFGTEPFQSLSEQMPGHAPKEMSADDLKLYRVNHATQALGIRSNELMANLNVYSGVMVYGGVDSVESDSLIRLMTTFVKQDPTWYIRGGFINSIENPRLLDLLSVGFDYSHEKGVYRRPSAVPRFGVFKGVAHVMDVKAAQSVLVQPDFHPREQVVIEDSQSNVEGSNREVELPQLVDVGFSKIELRVADGSGSYLLFNDSYSPDWTAKINGTSVPIERANMNFMAVKLSPGENLVQFRFVKAKVLALMKLGFTLLALLLAAMFTMLGVSGWRKLSSARMNT
jgi:hypothetical protein